MHDGVAIPRVSVIIPCHNQGQYIDTAVDSILRQTYANFEILIVNDASTDELTNRKLAAYSKPKTTVINIQAGNVSAARNSGIRHASGEYILTLDADDYFRPTFLEQAVAILNRHNGTAVVSCWLQQFGTRSGIWKPKGGGPEDFLLSNNCCSGALFRRSCWEAVGGYDEKLPGYEDWDFWLRIAICGWTVHILAQPLFCYRVSATSKIHRSNAARPQLIRHIIANSRTIYRQHIADIVVQQVARIQSPERYCERHRILRWIKQPVQKIISTVAYIRSTLASITASKTISQQGLVLK